MMRNHTLAAFLVLVLAVLAWSWVHPLDRYTWWLEATPALAALVILPVTHRRFPLSTLAYGLLALHCVLLLVGAHYTYAEVPCFSWLRDHGYATRNHYDRLGHFFQGFIPAIIARELLLRTSPLKPGKWLFAIVTLSCLGISAAYELVEWMVCVTTEGGAPSFLGLQGDVWDTQKDMAMALTGAMVSQLTLRRMHERSMHKLLRL